MNRILANFRAALTKGLRRTPKRIVRRPAYKALWQEQKDYAHDLEGRLATLEAIVARLGAANENQKPL